VKHHTPPPPKPAIRHALHNSASHAAPLTTTPVPTEVVALGHHGQPGATSSSRPWLLMAMGVVLLGVALALLLRPSTLRLSRRNVRSAYTR
jgi:hypothetical protein